eukprot:1735805-Alexandrium_andersonii.AAC.1
MLFHREKVRFMSDMPTFCHMFLRRPTMTAEDLFVAPEAEVKQDLLRRAKENFISDPESTLTFEKVYTPSFNRRLEQKTDALASQFKLRGMALPTVGLPVFDLEQNLLASGS